MARIKTGGVPQKKKKLDPEAIAKALAGDDRSVDSGMLLNAIIENWGGYQAFSRDIFSEYQAMKPGAMGRQKILEMVNRLTIVVTSQEIAKPRSPGDMTDEELATTARRYMAKLNDADPPAGAEEDEENPAA